MGEGKPQIDEAVLRNPSANAPVVRGRSERWVVVGVLCVVALLACIPARKAYLQGQEDTRNNALLYAAMINSPTVSTLLEQGADPNATAVEQPPHDFLNFCLQMFRGGRKSSQDKKTALMYAAENGNLAMVKKLIDAKAEVNARDAGGFSALLWAVYQERKDSGAIILLLAEHGADLNVAEEGGATAWRLASTKPTILKALQQAKALQEGRGKKP